MHLPVDTLLHNGTYRIVRFIDSGGFGCTYEAEHVFLQKRVAIKEFFVKDFCNRDEKTFHITIGANSKQGLVSKMRRKFIDEAKALHRLSHPGIVSVSDVFEDNNTAYFVMDYIDGRSLKEIISAEGALTEEQAVRYISSVSEALRYIHKHNRLHLDIKPGNIMVDSNDNPILIDFGASKQYAEDGSENTSTLMGKTPGYAPPEQMSNRIAKFMPATDIYALGATLYKLLTATTPPDSLLRIGEDVLEPLSDKIGASTRNAVKAAMSMDKRQRPQNIDEFLKLLKAPPTEKEPEADVPDEDIIVVIPPAEGGTKGPDGGGNNAGGGSDSGGGLSPESPETGKSARHGSSWWLWVLIIFAMAIGLVAGFYGMSRWRKMKSEGHATEQTTPAEESSPDAWIDDTYPSS